MDEYLIKTILASRTGCRQSQKELYFLTIGRMKEILRRYCYDRQDAQDLIQSTYLKIYNKLGQFDLNKGDFFSWAGRILINEYFKLQKRKKSVLSLEDDSFEMEFHIHFDWSKMTLSEVQRVIAKLNQPHAIILNLYFFEQLEYSELAEIFNIKESSVRSNLSRAKKAFEEEWLKFNNSKKLVL